MTELSDEGKRIKSYLGAQGAKLTPAAIVERVRAAMDALHEALAAVPVDRAAERPTPEDWSAVEVLAHVVESGAHFGTLITRQLDGASAAPAPSAADAEAAPRSATAWWSRLVEDRETLFDRVLRADPDTRLEPAIEHPFFGALNWREALLFLRVHDLDHARQIQAVAAALAGKAPDSA